MNTTRKPQLTADEMQAREERITAARIKVVNPGRERDDHAPEEAGACGDDLLTDECSGVVE